MMSTDWDWPSRTVRGEYDSDHDRIVCAYCPWYDTGGPTATAWTYHDHLVAEHPGMAS